MKALGNAVDWLHENIDKASVRNKVLCLFVILLLAIVFLLAGLPSHKEYCQTAVSNPTCAKYERAGD